MTVQEKIDQAMLELSRDPGRPIMLSRFTPNESDVYKAIHEEVHVAEICMFMGEPYLCLTREARDVVVYWAIRKLAHLKRIVDEKLSHIEEIAGDIEKIVNRGGGKDG